MNTSARYNVRLGDDGRTYSTHETFEAAMVAALAYAESNWAGKAQVLDTLTHERTTVRAQYPD